MLKKRNIKHGKKYLPLAVEQQTTLVHPFYIPLSLYSELPSPRSPLGFPSAYKKNN